MKTKKVGIITLPGNFNYGNRLQCYALAEILLHVGVEPYVLERERAFRWHRRAYYSLKEAVQRARAGGVGANPEKMRTPGRVEAFERFGRNIPITTLRGSGYSARDKFDLFMVGSDQVWNPDGIRHQEDWYFATFARPVQRVAVAASLGIGDFASDRQAKRVAKGVGGFLRVSVREERGAELIRECAGIDARVICDPTLVLSAERWRAVSDGRLTPFEPYVFTYLLGGVGAEAEGVLDQVTDCGRVPVVPLSDRQKPGEPDAGPAEFVDLIDHATHVVTDSFHAAVFSSILQTPLTVVHREGGAGMFSRLEQLSRMLGIEEKVYGSSSYDLALAGEYGGVSEAIDRERNKFMDYLGGCLDA